MRVLACGCILGYERCFDCRAGLHPDQETALAVTLRKLANEQERLGPEFERVLFDKEGSQ